MKPLRRCLLLCAACLCLSDVEAADSGYRLLHGLNTLDGTTLTWGQPLAQKELGLSTEAAFRSEGAASAYLRGLGSDHRGNQYLGFKVAVPKTDLVDKRLRFDAWTATPEATQALYVRYYDSAGEMVGSWHNWGSPFRKESARTFSLRTGTLGRGFRHESSNVGDRVADAVVAIEFIIGTRDKNAPFDLFVDSIRVSKQTVASATALAKAKTLYLETALVRDGRPAAAIVAAPGDGYRAVAQRIGRTLGLPVVDAMSAEEMAKTNVVLLGNVNTNPSLAPLYAYSYTAADAVYPGAGGHVYEYA